MLLNKYVFIIHLNVFYAGILVNKKGIKVASLASEIDVMQSTSCSILAFLLVQEESTGPINSITE